jgi:hypothetical protein
MILNLVILLIASDSEGRLRTKFNDKSDFNFANVNILFIYM